MKKIAAFDVDGVLAEFEPFLVECLYEVYGMDAAVHRNKYDFRSRYAEKPEILNATFALIDDPNIYYGLDENAYAVNLVRQAMQRDYDILFITARPTSSETFTKRWLKKLFPDFGDTLGLAMVEEKSIFLKDIHADFLIDDNPEEVHNCQWIGVSAFAWEQPWNSGTFPRVFPDRIGGEIRVQASEDQDWEFFWSHLESTRGE